LLSKKYASFQMVTSFPVPARPDCGLDSLTPVSPNGDVAARRGALAGFSEIVTNMPATS
jgi:hypothetical protein